MSRVEPRHEQQARDHALERALLNPAFAGRVVAFREELAKGLELEAACDVSGLKRRTARRLLECPETLAAAVVLDDPGEPASETVSVQETHAARLDATELSPAAGSPPRLEPPPPHAWMAARRLPVGDERNVAVAKAEWEAHVASNWRDRNPSAPARQEQQRRRRRSLRRA